MKNLKKAVSVLMAIIVGLGVGCVKAQAGGVPEPGPNPIFVFETNVRDITTPRDGLAPSYAPSWAKYRVTEVLTPEAPKDLPRREYYTTVLPTYENGTLYVKTPMRHRIMGMIPFPSMTAPGGHRVLGMVLVPSLKQKMITRALNPAHIILYVAILPPVRK